MADLNAKLAQANTADGNKDFSLAAQLYGEILAHPSMPEDKKGTLHLYRAVSLFNGKKYDEASASFLNAIKSKDEAIMANAWSGLAKCFERQGKMADACDAYAQLEKVDAKREFFKFDELAHCYNDDGQHEKALDVAGKGLVEQPAQAGKLHNERLFAFFKLGRPLDALQDVESVLKLKERSEMRDEEVQLYSDVLSRQGVKLSEGNDYAGALNYFKKADDLSRSANSAFQLGFVHSKMDQSSHALNQFKKAEERDGTNWRYPAASGAVILKMPPPDHAEAINYFKKSLSLSPEAKNAVVMFQLGYCEFALSRNDEAKETLKWVYDNDESHWQASALLGTISVNMKLYEDAVEQLSRCIATANGQEDWTVHYNLAFALMMLGRNKEALEEFQKALGMNPSSTAAQNAVERLKEEIRAEEERARAEEEAAKEAARKAEEERIAREKEAERLRLEAEENERKAKAEKDAKKKAEAERKAREERQRIEQMRREAEAEKQRVEEERRIKIQKARERRLKRLEALKVKIGGPQTQRLRRPSLDLIPKGNTGKNANAYAEWFNVKVAHLDDKGFSEV